MKDLLLVCGIALAGSIVLMAQTQPTPPAPGAKDSWNKGSSYTLNGGATGGLRRGRAAGNTASPTKNLPFDPKDLSGVWWFRGTYTWSAEAPPMTPWGQAKFDAAKPGLSGPKAQPLGNDPMMSCEPMGFPRIMLYQAVPMEFMQVPGRVIVFYDWFHTWRTVWTDGRELPKEPEPRWLGFSVGKWDGDTFVVES